MLLNQYFISENQKNLDYLNFSVALLEWPVKSSILLTMCDFISAQEVMTVLF